MAVPDDDRAEGIGREDRRLHLIEDRGVQRRSGVGLAPVGVAGVAAGAAAVAGNRAQAERKAGRRDRVDRRQEVDEEVAMQARGQVEPDAR